jgi:hypothetical protein
MAVLRWVVVVQVMKRGLVVVAVGPSGEESGPTYFQKPSR